MSKKIFPAIFLSFLCLLITTSVISAESLTDTGVTLPIVDQNAVNGSVICSDAKGYVLCANEYDSSMYGVVNNAASTALIIKVANSQIVVTKGETIVRVSSTNGNIKKGDFITSSTKPGVAELSKTNGFVLGTALEDYSSGDKNAVGTIKVAINIHPRIGVIGSTSGNLLDILRSGLAGLGFSPIAALRYILASAMVLTSFIIGFLYFGRIAKTGVEAIGRNPLAGIRIQVSVLVNVLIMLAVVAAGLVVAYLILAL